MTTYQEGQFALYTRPGHAMRRVMFHHYVQGTADAAVYVCDNLGPIGSQVWVPTRDLVPDGEIASCGCCRGLEGDRCACWMHRYTTPNVLTTTNTGRRVAHACSRHAT